jgi:hypothetical protein
MAQMTRAFVSRQQLDQVFKDVLGGIGASKLEQDIFAQSATQKYELGTRRVINNGGLPRVFYYAHIHASLAAAGASRGRVMMASDAGTERGAFLGAQTAGAKTVTWTCVGDVVANQFKNGFVLLQGGFVREIRSHPAGGAGENITLTLYDPLPESIGAGRYGILLENPYANVYSRGAAGVHPNAEGPVMGVLGFDSTPDYYVWLQTWGPCGVIATPATLGDADNEMELHHGINPGDEVGIAAGHGYQSIGYSMVANAINWDNENFMIVDLRIRR